MKSSINLDVDTEAEAMRKLALLPEGISHLEVSDITKIGLDALFQCNLAPALEKIMFRGSSIDNFLIPTLLSSCYRFSQLKELAFIKISIDDNDLYLLANSPFLAQLESLSFSMHDVEGNHLFGYIGVQALANSIFSIQLKKLSFYHVSLFSEGAAVLANSKYLGNLQDLCIVNCKVDSKGLGEIVDKLNKLEKLTVYNDPIGVDGTIFITRSESIKKICIGSQELGYKSLTSLAMSPFSEQLQSLEFDMCGIGPIGTHIIASSPFLRQLRHLSLKHNVIGIEGVGSIAQSPNLNRLQHLNLFDTALDVEGIKLISHSSNMKQLQHLNLSNNYIGDEGTEFIANSPFLKQLRYLYLYSCNVGDEGAQFIANSPFLKQLRHLDLSGNNITKQSMKALVTSECLVNLKSIKLGSNDVGLSNKILNDLTLLRNEFLISNVETKVPNPHVRVMIIGEPNVGKTTLYKRLTGKEVSLGEEARTHGIDFGELDGFEPFRRFYKKKEYVVDPKVSLWDTGGQEVQQMCHGLFVDSTPIYMLVMDESSTADSVKHWLDMLELRMACQEITIIPVINLKSEQSPPRNYSDIHEYINSRSGFRKGIKWCSPEFVNLGAEDSITVEQLRSSLERTFLSEHFCMDWRAIHDISAEYSSRNTHGDSGFVSSHVPYDMKDSFINKLTSMNSFILALERIHEGFAAIGESSVNNRSTFAELVIEHMNSLGVITALNFYSKKIKKGESKETCFELDYSDSIILHDLAWVQKGIYGLFPPKDDDWYTTDTVKVFIERLDSDENEYGLPGVLTLAHVEPFWTELGIEKHHQKQLLNLLMHDRLNIVTSLPDSNNVYFVPAYLEKKYKDSNAVTLEDVKQVDEENKKGRGGSCWVIKAPENLWPSHFIYTHMARTATRARNKDSIFQWRTGEKPKARHYKLQLINNPNALVEVFFIDEVLWCFTYPKEAGQPHDYKDLQEKLFSDFQELYSKSVSQGYRYKLIAHIPCPDCMDIISDHTKVESLSLHEVLKLEANNASSKVKCPKVDVTSHKSRSAESLLQGELTRKKLVGTVTLETWCRRNKFSFSSLQGLVNFLLDNGMAKRTESSLGFRDKVVPVLARSGEEDPALTTEKSLRNFLKKCPITAKENTGAVRALSRVVGADVWVVPLFAEKVLTKDVSEQYPYNIIFCGLVDILKRISNLDNSELRKKNNETDLTYRTLLDVMICAAALFVKQSPDEASAIWKRGEL